MTRVTADSVISEVRRAKTAIAEKYGFDVIAMVRGLRRIDHEVDAVMAIGSIADGISAPTSSNCSEQVSRQGMS
jgi:hypothetical protein